MDLRTGASQPLERARSRVAEPVRDARGHDRDPWWDRSEEGAAAAAVRAV